MRPLTGVGLTITVSVATGAEVSATKGTTTITGTSSSGVCILKIPETGSWTVSATLNGQTSTSMVVNVVNNYVVNLYFANSTLNNNSWDIIKGVSDANQGANYWSVGDRKSVTLNGTVGSVTFSNFSTYAFILGFNHNSTYEGMQRIHFQLAKTALTGGTDIAFVDSSYGNTVSTSGYFSMNTTATNVGGWWASQMRNDYLGDSGSFINALPSDLRNVLKLVSKYSNNYGDSNNKGYITPTNDYMFLLSEYEAFGTTSYSVNKNESSFQARYAYYAAGNSKKKYRHSSIASTATWWFRSCASGSKNFVTCNTSAAQGNSNGNLSWGVAPGFCV